MQMVLLLYKPIKDDNDVCDLQMDINTIYDWVQQSGLTLNTTKTQLLVISRLRHRPTIHLSVCGASVSESSSVNYLEVTLASDLSWAPHIDLVCQKAKHQAGLIYRQFYYASPACKSQLYRSLVLPTLDYCSSLWDPTHVTYTKKLEDVQKLAARIVSRKWDLNHQQLLSNLLWPSLADRRKRQKLALFFRIVKGNSLIHPSFFIPHPSSHLRHNHSLPLYYPMCHSHSHLSSFAVSVVPPWNCLPSSLVDVSSINSFKRGLKLLPTI